MKKIYASVILGFVAIGILWWLANYLSTGIIEITTNNKNDTITLQETTGSKPFVKIGASSVSATVKHGQYIAKVRNGSRTTIQVINFNEGHKTFRYFVSLTSPLKTEPVAYENGQDIDATTDQLVYLNASSGMLRQINNENNLTDLNNTLLFQTVKWASPSFGVGQIGDGRLYTIAGNSVNSLKVPFSYGGQHVNFDVLPDKKIYVSYGADVYSGSQSEGFKKIYTSSSSNPALVAGTSGLAVSDSKYGKNATHISKPLLTTINVNGKNPKKNVEAERMAWSPNGQYLAVGNQANPTIYNNNLRQVAVIPTNFVVGQFEWLNNTTLLYTSSSELWTYDLTTQKIQLLVNMATSDSITGLYLSQDRSYVYLTTFDSGSGSYEIKRVGLNHQKVPDYIYRLQDILPDRVGNYVTLMVNFYGQPKMIVSIPPGTSAQNDLNAVIGDLQSRGFSPNELRFQTMPVESR